MKTEAMRLQKCVVSGNIYPIEKAESCDKQEDSIFQTVSADKKGGAGAPSAEDYAAAAAVFFIIGCIELFTGVNIMPRKKE